jgi:hypothetical protein
MNTYNFNLTGQSSGPGMAASVILNVLLDELVKKNVLTHDDVARLLSIADSTLEQMGDTNALTDARAVLNGMRGP